MIISNEGKNPFREEGRSVGVGLRVGRIRDDSGFPRLLDLGSTRGHPPVKRRIHLHT